jgi:hypothetical protein
VTASIAAPSSAAVATVDAQAGRAKVGRRVTKAISYKQ